MTTPPLTPPEYPQLKPGDTVRAFDPRTLGVIKHGTIVRVGRRYATIDFGLTGSCRVALRDILETT